MEINDNHIGILEDGIITMSWNAADVQTIGAGQVVHLTVYGNGIRKRQRNDSSEWPGYGSGSLYPCR